MFPRLYLVFVLAFILMAGVGLGSRLNLFYEDCWLPTGQMTLFPNPTSNLWFNYGFKCPGQVWSDFSLIILADYSAPGGLSHWAHFAAVLGAGFVSGLALWWVITVLLALNPGVEWEMRRVDLLIGIGCMGGLAALSLLMAFSPGIATMYARVGRLGIPQLVEWLAAFLGGSPPATLPAVVPSPQMVAWLLSALVGMGLYGLTRLPRDTATGRVSLPRFRRLFAGQADSPIVATRSGGTQSP